MGMLKEMKQNEAFLRMSLFSNLRHNPSINQRFFSENNIRTKDQ